MQDDPPQDLNDPREESIVPRSPAPLASYLRCSMQPGFTWSFRSLPRDGWDSGWRESLRHITALDMILIYRDWVREGAVLLHQAENGLGDQQELAAAQAGSTHSDQILYHFYYCTECTGFLGPNFPQPSPCPLPLCR